jgi:hypothetical protein
MGLEYHERDKKEEEEETPRTDKENRNDLLRYQATQRVLEN